MTEAAARIIETTRNAWESEMAAQLIPLSSWAENVFGERKPHRNTLLNWIRNGRIRPAPRKVGREYFCRPDAEYVDPVAERIERMANGS